jgi:sulfhydrogenase subunit beta (sulfur reductase)
MKLCTRDALARWLDALGERATLIAPRWVEGELLYRRVAGSDEIVFDFQRAVLSPKSFLLPDTDVLLEVSVRQGEVTLREPAPEGQQVIFGVRPCDARGLRVLDALLLDRSPPDAAYAARRDATTLVGLACPRLWDDCFCTSLGGAPDDASDLDLLLSETAGGYLVQVVTDKGAALADTLEGDETDAQPPASDRSGKLRPVLPPKAWAALFEEAYWRRLADRCLSCHACTYVCPTCRCFDVRDEVAERRTGYTKYDRLRCWDSCTGANYRVIAGGHNSRALKSQRLRNRFLCKFYYVHEDYNVQGCVGCGRCIEVCPVNIDIVEMLHSVAQDTEVVA